MAFPGGAGFQAVSEERKEAEIRNQNSSNTFILRSPPPKTRSLSDGGGTPKLSPSPHIFEASRRQSKDDSLIRERDRDFEFGAPPATPTRASSSFPPRGLSLQMPTRDLVPTPQEPPASPYIKPGPLSPKLDQSQIYASPPTNILPRRSRGLDFSRAATSLHHSTLANQTSPDSSPTIGSRAMNIPGRRAGEYGGVPDHAMWPTGGNQERMHISSSLGSNNHMMSDTSSSSGDDDYMDEDMDEGFLLTPQAAKGSSIMTPATSASPWAPAGSPAVNSLMSFQQRQRPRKQPKRKLRGPLGLGLSSAALSNNISKSPPNSISAHKELPNFHSRRESISWAANQLHISGSESDDNHKTGLDGPGVGSPSRPGVIRRAVTRRGNLLPKTKGFARIRAALAEESAPVESDFRREAEVVRQVLESDMPDLELRPPPVAHSAATTAFSSPNMGTEEIDDMPEDAMIMDSGMAGGLNLAGTFKQQALKNSKGNKGFWDTMEGSMGAPRITPPPPSFGLPRGSSSGLSLDDVSMDSPSASSNGAGTNPFVFALPSTTRSSSGNETPQQTVLPSQEVGSGSGATGGTSMNPGPPSAAEITRRINGKRRRDDDFDPVSFKRRAVSPGMSSHNSPIMQSPLQRDMAPWGPGSRPSSVGGDTSKPGPGSGAPSENGSMSGTPNTGAGGGGGGGRERTTKGRVGFQGMVDTNDNIARLSIE